MVYYSDGLWRKFVLSGGIPIRTGYNIKIYRCLALLLAALFLAGLSGAASAQEIPWGQPLRWEEIDQPSINGEIILAPSEVNRIAASRDVVYALDTINYRLHRSDNGGLTFTDITASLNRTAGMVLPGWEIAVAPGLSQYVAVVTNNRTSVFISDDSGATWYPTGPIDLSGGTIQCIAISNGYTSGSNTVLHDIAIGTGDGTGTGYVFTFQMGGSFSNWSDQGLSRGDVSSVAFSPRYQNDATILAVAATATETDLHIGTRDLSSQTTTWDSTAGYPLEITLEGDGGGVKIASSISLPSDYGGTEQKTRLAFVSYNNNSVLYSSYNDVYRIDDDADPRKQPLNAAGGANIHLSSIAYFGTQKSGKLLAGFADPSTLNVAQVKWTLTPLGTGTVNSTYWYNANQPPSGPAAVQVDVAVAWSYSGTVGFCGTGQKQPPPPLPPPPPPPPPPGPLSDESAFSQSLDNGNNWQQTSLMNTTLQMTDIAPAPDSLSLFMATCSQSGPESVWRAAGEPLGRYWGRLLNMPTNTNRVILRLSPNYATDYTLYAVEVDNITLENSPASTNILEISLNRGNTWQKRTIPGPVIDMVTASQYTLYMATSGGCVRKSTDGGVTWGGKVETGLHNINTLTVSDNGHIFAGSTDGWVAYSNDEGASFTEIQVPVSYILSDIQVVPDANYAANNIIYAGGRTDTVYHTTENITGGVWRWTIGQSSDWKQIDISISDNITGEQISGLKTGPEGTLYALMAENVSGRFGGITRTLDPVYPVPELMEWDVVNRSLAGSQIAFDPAPLDFAGDVPWLKLSGNTDENDLWAIDTANGLTDNTTAIYEFRDTLCKVGPWITGPSEVGSDPVSGRNQQVDLSWEQLSLSDRYELQLAKDAAFTLRIDPAINNSENVSAVTGSILIRTDPVNVTSPALWLPPGSLPEAGATYYWRIRTDHAATGEYIRSPWSDTDNFIVKPGFPVTAPYYGPQLLSPADDCDCAFNLPIGFTWTPDKETTAYKFELSERSDMSRPLVSTTVGVPAYLYSGQLKNDTIYFWRVAAVEPVPGESSATFSFHTAPASAPAHLAPKSQSIPLWAIIGMVLGLLACVALLVLILRRWGVLSREEEEH